MIDLYSGDSEKIVAGDPLALPKLNERLQQRQRELQLMKAANKALRHKDESRRLELMIDSGWDEGPARMLLKTGEKYTLKELRKQHTIIRQIKDRIATIMGARKRGPKEIDVIPGVVYFEDPKEMRVGFRFDRAAMPKKLIDYMRDRGYVYKMITGSWQRTLTDEARLDSTVHRRWLRRLHEAGEYPAKLQ